MEIASLKTVFLTLAFVAPGFMFHSIISFFSPRKTEIKELTFIKFFTYSFWNFAIWSWLIYLMTSHEFFLKNPTITAACWALILLISPILLGFLFSWFEKKEFFRNFMIRLGLSPIHPIPTSWDYFFHTQSRPIWLLITLKDGSQVAGFFGENSFASNTSEERDLYIEKMCAIEDDGNWRKIEESNGILIKHEEIKHMEFWND